MIGFSKGFVLFGEHKNIHSIDMNLYWIGLFGLANAIK